MFAEDPQVFLRDFGKPCSANGRDFLALVDQPGETLQLNGLAVNNTEWRLTVAATDVVAAGLAEGLAMTVDGAPATVRDPTPLGDGTFYLITFSR